MNRFFSFFILSQVLFITHIFAQLPSLSPHQFYLKKLIHYEQSVNDKVENLKEFTTINDVTLPMQYRPESKTAFSLESYLVPANDVVVINTNKTIPPELISQINGKNYYNFFVHPVSHSFLHLISKIITLQPRLLKLHP